MLIISQNLTNYEVDIPQDAIFRINLAWINNFIGIHVTYEPPTKPELVIDTENSTISHSVQKILDYIDKNKLSKNIK